MLMRRSLSKAINSNILMKNTATLTGRVLATTGLLGQDDIASVCRNSANLSAEGWGGLASPGLRISESLRISEYEFRPKSPDQIDSKKPTKLVSHSLPLLFCFFFGPKNAPNSVFSLIHDGTTISSMAVYQLLLVQHCRHCCCNVDDGASTAARPVNYRNNRQNHKLPR